MRLVEFMSLHIVAYLTMIALLFFQLCIRFNNIHLRLIGQVNNARVAAVSNEYEPSVTILDTNYFGMKNVTKVLLPLLRDSPTGPCIMNVSSMVSALEVIYQPYPSPLFSNVLKYRRGQSTICSYQYPLLLVSECSLHVEIQEGLYQCKIGMWQTRGKND
jgi:hypothetical protein